jgi:hypothetical protein
MNIFIVFAAIFSAVALAIVILVLIIKNKVSNITRNYLGMGLSETAKLLSDGLAEECRLPYSVPKLTPLYKPKIERDFPEMGYDRMESMVRNGITDILNTLESGENANALSNSSVRLRDQVNGIISDVQSRGEKQHFDDIKIHNVGIENYHSDQNTALAVFQAAAESRHYVTKNGQTVSGSKEKPTQHLFSLTLAHNQNVSEERDGIYLEANCPNCGAPIPSVGAKECHYCGSGVLHAVDKIWQIDSFRLLK